MNFYSSFLSDSVNPCIAAQGATQQHHGKSGEKAARRQMITQMLKNQWDAETIHEATKVSLEEITVIQSELQL